MRRLRRALARALSLAVALGWSSPAGALTLSGSPVLRSSDGGPHHGSNGFTITGKPSAKYAKLDAAMKSFMQQYGIRAGELAVAKNGALLFSHGYTNTTDASYLITQPTSLMRIASNSKAFITGAMTELYAAGAISPATRVYNYLDVTAPLLPSQTPDPDAKKITVAELVAHTAGFHNDDGTAPEFNMYSIERAAGNAGPLSDAQFTAYLYGQPLSYVPGTQMVYSNEDYYLLARVIEKATRTPYIEWINAHLLGPIGITDAVVSATAIRLRRANEVGYDDPYTGPSVLRPQVGNVLPDPYGGLFVYEVLDGPSSIAISAQSLAVYAGHYNVYGLGGRAPGYAREGSIDGTTSWMESLNDGYDFAFTFNSRVDQRGQLFDISQLTGYFEHNI